LAPNKCHLEEQRQTESNRWRDRQR